jgi:hypothetical protein
LLPLLPLSLPLLPLLLPLLPILLPLLPLLWPLVFYLLLIILMSLKGIKASGEIEVYADALAHWKSIGKIYTHHKKGVVLEPVKADSKPTRDSLNDAEAWTAFGLADGTNLLARILISSSMTLGTKRRTIAQRSLPSDGSLSPSAIILSFQNWQIWCPIPKAVWLFAFFLSFGAWQAMSKCSF